MSTLRDVILELAAERGPGKSFSPAEAAQAFDPDGWRGKLRAVRTEAVGLAREGRIVILRKGKPADPEDFRGVYRLAIAS